MKEYTGSKVVKKKSRLFSRNQLAKEFLGKPFKPYDKNFIKKLNNKGLKIIGWDYSRQDEVTYNLQDKNGGTYVFEVEKDYGDYLGRSFVTRILM